jgi:hypothetical protein
MYKYLYNYKNLIKSIISPSQFYLLGRAKYDVLLISHAANWPVLFKKKSYSPLIEPLKNFIEKNGWSTLNIERPFGVPRKKKYWSKSINIDKLFFKSFVLNYFSIKKVVLLNFWKKILLKTGCKLVICIQPYPELCAAGKILKIPICDLQHGSILSSVNYYIKNSKNNSVQNGLPDIGLCWDEISKKQYENKLNVPSFVIGYPWFAEFFKKKSKNIIVNYEKKILRSIVYKKPIILLTLQWGTSVSKIIDVPNNLLEALKLLIESDWILWVKFHPLHNDYFSNDKLYHEWKIVTNLNFDSKKIYDVTNYSMPNLLKWTTVHVTRFSYSAVEAKLLNVQTFIYSKNKYLLKNNFGDHLKSNLIKNITDYNSKKIFHLCNKTKKTQIAYKNIFNEKKVKLIFKNLIDL